MKNIKTITLFAFAILLFNACKNNTQPEIKTVTIDSNTVEEKKALDPNATYAKVEFGIEGMTCAMGCAKTIEKKMAKMDGVKSAKVDFDKRLAMVEYDEAKVTHKSLEAAVTKAGDIYKVTEMKFVDTFNEENKATCEELCRKACAEKGKDMASAKDCSETCKKKCAEKALKS